MVSLSRVPVTFLSALLFSCFFAVNLHGRDFYGVEFRVVTPFAVVVDPNNNRVFSTDANTNKTKFLYDGANRLVERVDGFESEEQTQTTFKYEKVGNLLEEKDGRVTGKTFDIKNTHDALNRLEMVEDAVGSITSFEYDGEGNRIAQVEPKGQPQEQVFRTEFDYGELGELIEVRMADGGVFNYVYDPNRNRIRQTDGENHVVEFQYDELNRLDLMTQDPDGFNLVTDHDYDENGNEILLTDPKGQKVEFTYDELNRMTAKIFHLTPADNELYTRTHRIDFGEYDGNDNLLQVDELRSSGTDPPAVFSNFKTYDDLDRLETETDSFNKLLAYDYDNQGNRTLLSDPDGKRTVYGYDALNRLETVKLEEGTANEQHITYKYFPDGLKETVTNPNNTTSTYDYDAADRLTSILHQAPTGTISSYGYVYDPNGNRLSQIETNAGRIETTTYDYDEVNRLKEVTYETGRPNAKTTTYTYDKVGNRKTEQEVEVETSNILKDLVFGYDEINRLEMITDNLNAEQNVAYEYDANGNTTSKTKAGVTTTFHYDIQDQLGEVQQDSSILGRYGYDYNGRRILKIGDDGRRHYTYDQLSVIAEADDTDTTVSKYDYGLDQLVSLDNRGEGRSFFHLDFLDSTVNLTFEDGTVRESIIYDAWGNERDRIGTSANRFTFTGHETDRETGLIYAKARFYDPDIGRFLTQDSVFGNVSDPPSLHRYLYTNANPTRYIDPTGHWSWEAAWETVKSVPRAVAEPALEVYDVALVTGAKVMGIPPEHIELQSALGRRQQQRIEEGQGVVEASLKGSAEVGAAVLTRGLSVVGQSYGETAIDWAEGDLTIDELDRRLTSTSVGTSIAAGSMAFGRGLAQRRAAQQAHRPPASGPPKASRIVEGSKGDGAKVPAATEAPAATKPPAAPQPTGSGSRFAGKQRFDATKLSDERVDAAILKSIRRKSGARGTSSGQIAADAKQTRFMLEKVTAWRRNVHATDPGYSSLRSLSPQLKGTFLHSSVQSRVRSLNIEGLRVNQRLYGQSPYTSPATGAPYEYRIPDFGFSGKGGTIFDIKPRGTPLSGAQYQDFRSFGQTNDIRWIYYDPY